MPREYKVKVDTARAIKGILDQYPAGNGILRELIQNSDDAAAKKQIFILDCRSHPGVSLVDATLAQSQGPALLAVNDTVFTDTNWEALATINASDKVADETKAGKYGLGMKAAYHITEHLQVLSGTTFAVFDPQDQFQAPFTGGCRIDFVNEGQDYTDQLAPFLGIIKTLSKAYEGTVVRLPLRTPKQAARTKIKDIPTTVGDIRSLFIDFIEKELEIVMLFLKHITTIELQEITADGKLKVLANVAVDGSDLTPSRAFTRGATACTETFKSCIRFQTANGQSSRTWRIYHSIQPRSHTNALLKRRLQYDVENELVQDKLFAHVALAYPLDGPRINGKLFTLLPLPIVTGFPLHIHAVLALTADRQSLRNKQEEGFSLRSRERLLVEWNQLMFDEYIPSVWIKLFEVLICEDGISNIWSAWPILNSAGSSDLSYWGRILHNILRISANEAPRPAVFPSGQNFVTLTSGLIAQEQEDHSVTDVLRRIGVTIVVVPQSVSIVLQELQAVTLHEDFTVGNVYQRLLQRTNIMTLVPNSDKDIILNYLVSTKTLQYVTDLPLIPLVDGSRIALRQRGTGTNERYIIVSSAEEELYHDYAPMIPFPMLPLRVQTAFSGEQLSKFKLNAEYLTVDHVIRFLNRRFAHLDPSLDEVPCTDDDVKWTIKFWDWMDDSTSADRILQRADRFHLLPTSTRTLRQVNSHIPLPIADPDTAVSWGRLGVPFLHKDAPTKLMTKHQKIILNEDIPALISLVEDDKIPTLDRRSFSFVKKHIITSFQAQKRSIKLNTLQLTKYKRFPIFPLRAPQSRSQWTKGLSRTYDGAIDGRIEFVYILDHSPVPIINGTVLVDVSKNTRILALALDPQAVSKALDEVGVLRLATRQLNMQSSDNIDALTSRIIPRLNDLCQDTETRELLRGSRIVPLSNGAKSRPQDLIYPSSDIADLYEGEKNKFPSLSFYHYLPAMQVHNFFQATLTGEVVTDRIQYISRFGPSDPRMRKKAKLLLELLDKHWSNSFSGIPSLSQAAWLPVETGGFSCSTMCRDMNRRELFDQVLLVVDAKLTNSHLRAALGWDKDVPFDVLFRQFLKTLEQTGSEKRNEQLVRIIKYMIPLVVQWSVPDEELALFKEAVADKKWIPVSRNECTDVQHAVLSRRFKPTASFRLISAPLIENDGDVFFKIMGCTDEPSLESIITELQNDHPIPDVIAILQHLADHPDMQDNHRKRILIPTRNGNLRPSPEVYFEDISTMDVLFISSELLPAHPSISRDLASKLKLQFSSSIALGYEDKDEEQMAEDLMHRIKSVCSDYGIEYAFNEFLANAADAGAQKFASLIDQRTFPKQSLISPTMDSLQGPALLLFNDRPFSDDDFIGIRRIGKGGKLDNPDTIGRFGLGALSLYNFTDVVTIVSRGTIMILDPSGSHLPPRRGYKRTCLSLKVSDISSRYPDQIAPFQGLFYFSSESDYQGTIFRLPLKAEVDIYNLMNGAYLELAKNALFFTCLEEISAWTHPPSGRSHNMWQVKGTRSNLNPPSLPFTEQDVFNTHELELNVSLSLAGGKIQEHWIISKLTRPVQSLPADCIPTLQALKLDHSKDGLTICVALCRGAKEPLSFSLFSGLRLPERVSLPVHLNAPFSLASDRRNIRFDPPDANGRRTRQSVYNHWILKDLLPCLYLRSLACAYERYGSTSLPERSDSQPLWWPCNPADEVSRIVTEGFYSLLPSSSEKVFRSIDGKLLSAHEAVFFDEEPYRIKSLLIFMKAESAVHLPYNVRSLILRDNANSSTFQRVSADFLINSIRQSPMKFSTSVKEKFANPALDLDSVVNFILSGCTTVPWDLSLLFTEAQSCIPLPALEQPPLYFHSLEKVPSIFPASRFLHHEFQESTIFLLQENSVNIRPFDFTAVECLMLEKFGDKDSICSHSAEDAEWISHFWQLYAQSKLLISDNFVDSVISRLPLLETYDGCHVSVTHCLQSTGNVLPDPATSDYDGIRIADLISNMGIHVLRKPPPLLSKHIPNFSLNVVLACMRSQASMVQISSLSQSDRNEFARWVRSQLERQTRGLDGISADLKQTLFQLPIWPAQRGRLRCLVSSCDLKMLPSGISLSIVTTFLNPDVPVAEYSFTLHSKCDKVAINLDELLSLVEVPDILPLSELQGYRFFLDTILRWPAQLDNNRVSAPLRVPNSDGSMTLVRNLYDSDVDLFSQALESSHFPHPDLRNLQHGLRSWGLRHAINYNSFYECANTIDEDVRHNRNQDNIIDKARTVYHCYNHMLPLLRDEALSAFQWSSLNDLHFIPRNATRRHAATYEADNYASPLFDVLSPAQVVREEFEAVAWTQRGLVESDAESRPSRLLLAKNSNFGVPSTDQVIDHLVVLSTKIAPSLGYRNQSLRADLHATYTWLANQLSTRATYLKSLVHPTEPLFLNVDDPNTDPWVWHGTACLIFNLPYPEKGKEPVRQFLQEFKPLLLALGAGEFKDAKRVVDHGATLALNAEQLREAFNALRKARRLTDIKLIPSHNECEDLDTGSLSAHASFLAASVPYFGDALGGAWREQGEFHFNGTFFQAKAVLDFLYTGEIFEKPRTSSNEDEAADLLRDLLELLELAERWQIVSLKSKVETTIIDYGLITLHTWKHILDEAGKLTAQGLVKSCVEFERENREVIQSIASE